MALPTLTDLTREQMPAPAGIQIDRWCFRMEPALGVTWVGVDPGQVHMGVALVWLEHANLYEIQLDSASDSVDRIMAVTTCMQLILAELPSLPNRATVEGAAYMAAYGQVPLETARTSATIALLQHGIWPVEVVPPKVVRQKVFGNGQLRAQEVWPTYPENAATALACALYAGKAALSG